MLLTYMSYPTYTLLRRIARLIVTLLAFFAVQSAMAQVPNITYTVTTGFQGGLHGIESMAADSAGNVFFTDYFSSSLYKETLNGDGSYTQSVVSTGAGHPVFVAIDSSDNLYVADGAHIVYKETLSGGSYIESIVANTFSQSYSLATDTTGDVYVLDAGTAGTGAVYKETLSGGTYISSAVVSGLNSANGGGIAVDTAGNVYIAEPTDNRVLKETLSGGTYTQTVIADSSTFSNISSSVPLSGIAVDAAGAVLLASPSYGIFKAVPNGATYTTTPVYFAGTSGIISAVSASLDSRGNLYLADDDIGYVTSVNELAESSGAENFGSLNVGTPAAAQTATFTFDVAGSLAATPYAVSTQGDLTLDFQAAATQPANACVTGRTYNVGDTCTVAAIFTPTRPGVRYGAIALFAPSGAPIATSFLQGVGLSPQVSFSPGALNISLGSTFATSLTVDSSSNVIFTDIQVGTVLESFTNAHPVDIITPTFTTGYTGPALNSSSGNYFGSGFVVDGAGNVIYADGYTPASSASPGATVFAAYDVNPTIITSPTGSNQINVTNYGNAFLASVPFPSTSVTPSSNNRPAVDGAGNLYFSDDSGNRIIEEQSVRGAYNKLAVVATGLNNPGDVVVDDAGAVYAADTGNNRIVKETPNGDGTYTQSIVDSGFSSPPEGLAIDRIGNLYISLFNNFQNSNVPFILKETLANNTYTQSTLTISGSEGLDVDSAGNVFAAYPASASSTFISNIAALDVATPPSFIFVQTAVGSTSADSPQTVTVTNNGNAPLNFAANPAITSGFTLSPGSTCSQSAALAPGTSCTLLINFVPTQGGVTNGTLTLTDNHLGNTASTQIIKLNGQATGTPQSMLTPSTLNFGNVPIGTVSAAQTATFQNTGTAALQLGFNFSGSNPGGFSETDNCGNSLAAGASCTIAVVCEPVIVETLTANLVANFLSPIPQQTIALTCHGTAAAPQAVLTPASANFGNVTVGTTSSAQTFTLTNAGNASLSITPSSISGAISSSFFVAPGTCGSTLAAGASCIISVTFSPATTGSFTASLSVVDAVGTQTAMLTGTGVQATAAQAALTPSSGNFNSITTGTTSAPINFTLTNAGNAALSITSFGISGANISSFLQGSSTCASLLAAGASCTIAITFAPTSAGTFTATLSVTDAVGTQTAALTGAATTAAAAEAALTPAAANFGSVTSGSASAAQTFTLANSGSAALSIGSIFLSGTGASSFAIGANTCGSTLTAGSSCTIAATFSPGSAGSFAATLSVTDALGTQTSSLTGIGTATPATADFAVTATPSSQSIVSGSSATYSVSVASTGGTFTPGVLLTASGLPPGATVTFSPASVTPGDSGAQSTMTVQTAANRASSSGEAPWGPFAAPVLAVALLVLPFRSRRRIFRGLACVLMLTSIAGTLTGCGGGFALPQSNPTTYTITVTGTSGSDTHFTTVTLTVQ